MYLKKKDADELLREQFRVLLGSIVEKNDYLYELWDDDDWAFVIKAQALVEDSLTRSIIRHIGESALSKSVVAMPLNGGDASKLAVAKELGLIDSQQKRFVVKLSELRNCLAHRPDYSNFQFDRYILSFTSDEKKSWKQAIPWFENKSGSGKWGEISITSPKATIHVAVFILVSLLEVGATEKEVGRRIQELSELTMKELFEDGSANRA